ncbi:MAG: beta strand repeat-containing protein [bacterium]|jgi:hypothetical protein
MPTRTWRGTIDSNWGTAGNWLEGAVPTSADDVVFDVSSSACTVNASARSCLTINFSAYTNTITMSNTITVGGDVTLGSSMIISGSSALIVNANATLRSNGRVWSNPLTLSGTSRTYTLADNWTVSNVLTLNGTTSQIINGSTIYSSGNLTSNTTAITSGTTNIELNGGTWSNSSTGVLRNNLTFNGNVSVNGNVYYNTGTLTYTGGTVTTTGSTLNIGASTTLNTSGMSWNNITLTTTGGVPTITNNSVITINGTFSIGNVKLDGSDFNCFGNVTHNASQTINGTATIYFKGNVNYFQGNNPPYSFRNNLVLDSGVNTITFTGLVGFDNITVTHSGGTVNASGSTINVNRNTVGLSTFNTSSVNWGNIELWGGTLVLSSDLNINGLLTMIGSSTTVNGSFNINANGGTTLNGVTIAKGTGTPRLYFKGGTVQSSNTLGRISMDSYIDGNITIGTLLIIGDNGSINYVSGVVTNTTNNTVSFANLNVSINLAGVTLNNVNFTSATNNYTITLLSNLNINGLLTTTGGSISGSFNINVSGGVTVINNGIFAQGTGTTVLNLLGGTWSITGTGVIRLNTVINGNITISGNVYYNTGTLTHSGGTVTSTGSTMNIGAATTITVNNTGFTLNNINTSANVTFAGTNGFPINGTYTCTTPGTTHTFVSTQTYSINSLNIAGTNASRVTLRSSSSGSKAIINLNSVQSEYYLNVTDIDGSGGATGWTFGGTVTNSDNWNASTTLYYVGASNFSATGSWAPYSGGVPIGSISAPASTDDTAFDVNSVNNCNMNAAGTCKSVNFSGYTATLTMTNTMTVSGNVTLASGMSISGSSALIVNATHTFTSNGKTWPNALTFSQSITITLTDDLNVNGLLTIGTLSNQIQTFNGTFNINCSGGLTVNSTFNQQGIGTTTVNILGGTFSGGGHRLNTNINGNVTINTIGFGVGILTYISGNVTVIGTCSLSGTLNVAPIIWNDVNVGTTTLLSDLNVNGRVSGFNVSFNGAFNVNVRNGLSIGNFLSSGSNTNINILGGILSVIQSISNTVNINGDVTISNYFLDGGTMNYLGGNVTILAYTHGTGTANYLGGKVKCTGVYSIISNGTFINFDKVNLITVTITAGRTITMNRFFNGTASNPTRIQCATAGANYSVTFQDTFEKIANNVKVSGCIASRPGQLLLTGANSNKGTNTGIRYINNVPNGIARNQAPISNQMMFGIGNISDPSFVAN